jgi:lipid II:glycine glycyltransferase (peptidoglycan interpeptide bridge formation enzyme)
VKSRHGWQPFRWSWQEGGGEATIAAAQVLVRRWLGRGLGYAPKGPLLDWTDPKGVEAALAGLEGRARAGGMLLLKIDPDVRADTPEGQAVVERLKARGWRPSREQIQYRNTMILDLAPDAETILMDMKSKWRYNVRLAKRRGVVVREAGVDDLPTLYAMYAETAERDEFIIREEGYYLDVWKTFMDAGQAVPLVAEVEGVPLAMLILFHFAERAWYMYGASRDLHRDKMPNHRLQWEAILRAKSLGCTTYDMWGAPDELDESDPMWGVYRFKVGFGAEFVPHIGAYDYVPPSLPNRLLHRAYAQLRPRLVALAQRNYWKRRSGDETAG